MLAACASMGRPEGGAKDELPPVFVRSIPEPGSINVSDGRISIYFDENVQVQDVMNKVVVSPVQKQTPSVVANGRHLSVELRDTLLPDATYTIDFSDAIRDLNESNILDGFAYDFSTGDHRDSLVIAGMLFEARNLEPAQGMMVGVYSNLADSALSTLPFDRIAKTDQYGRFVIRNLAPGTYNLFAVNDLNRDYHWDRSEDVAFYGEPITPTVESIVVTDTLRASNGLDSIVSRNGSRYFPNDILLTWFNQNYRSQYLHNYTRIDSTRISIEFGAPSDTFPEITLLNTPAAGRNLSEISRLDHSWSRDTLTYWIADSAVISTDTLLIAARYLRTDTLDQLTWGTDTLKIVNRDRKAFIKELEKKAKEREKIRKRVQSEGRDTIFVDEPTPLSILSSTRGSQELHRPMYFTVSEPLDSINQEGIHLSMQIDTIWHDLGPQALVRDSLNRQINYTLHHNWEEGGKYKLSIDSAAIVGIYGHVNHPFTTDFNVKKSEEYSTVRFTLTNIPEGKSMMAELLSSQDNPVISVPVVNGVATFTFVTPNTYYLRAYVDENSNGTWDTGSIPDKRQPEDVYYYHRKVVVKKSWDIAQTWDLYENPVEAQKPKDITKNKPKTRDKNRNDNQEEEEEEYYDEFGNPYDPYSTDNFSSPGYPSSSSNSYSSGSLGGMSRINR